MQKEFTDIWQINTRMRFRGRVSDDDDQEENKKNLRSTVRSVIGQRVRLVR